MSAEAPTEAHARRRGRVVEWHKDKGYGYVQDGRARLFAHIRDFSEHHVTPEPGAWLTYTLGADLRGRPCAKEILQPNDGGRLRPRHFVVLALLLATPALAVSRIEAPGLAPAIATIGLLASVASYGLYWWDKHRARRRDWRISEKMLHLWELLGGWPGAFLAQRHLRHKATKGSYQIVFWMIVAAHNYLALDWQLDWRITRAARDTLQELIAPAPTPPAKPKVY